MKPLEQMNIVDDFLAGSLIGHKEYGEAASRYILSCILNRKIGKLNVVTQKFLIGDNPERHGIRLDVYLDEEEGEIFDVEPDKNNNAKDIASLPKRARFYHDKIDTANLRSGSNYDDLRDVIVIFIMPYDPFGLNRMVVAVKQDGEVGIAYMKSFEIEEKIRREGEERGREEGIQEGIQKGIREGMHGMIRTCRRFKQTDAQIVQLLQEELNLTREQAEDALAKYTPASDKKVTQR